MQTPTPDSVRCVVIDFGFTLCPDLYFNVYPEGYPNFLEIVQKSVFTDGPLLDRWMLGEATLKDVAVFLTRYMDLDAPTILRYLEDGCRQLNFSPALMKFAHDQRALGRKLALVSVNMDVFTNIIVPSHHLDEHFDVIVNSAEYHNLHKDFLWSKAFEQLGDGINYNTSLLIDDGVANVAQFRKLGGLAHQYKDDPTFTAWLETSGF